jgi:hypothetical protein
VKAANREITVHLDTGAPYVVAFPTKFMKELPLSGPSVQKGKAKTHAGLVPIFVASLDGELSIGEFKLPTRELRFTDVVPFAAVEPKGQLGAEALHYFIVTLDSLNHRVRFEKPHSSLEDPQTRAPMKNDASVDGKEEMVPTKASSGEK